VKRISVAAFEGETPPTTSARADEVHWLRVGQLGKLLEAARKSGARHAMMAGQLAPANLFDLRPTFALILLARLRRQMPRRSLVKSPQLASIGPSCLMPDLLEDHVAPGHMVGPTSDKGTSTTCILASTCQGNQPSDIGQSVVKSALFSPSRHLKARMIAFDAGKPRRQGRDIGEGDEAEPGHALRCSRDW
jgi:hypothetical protein